MLCLDAVCVLCPGETCKTGPEGSNVLKKAIALVAVVAVAVLLIVAVALWPGPEPPAADEQEWREWTGQKLMLNINVFCAADLPDPRETGSCPPVAARLPRALADILRRHHIGGVVLFSENLKTAEQTRQLTTDLQRIRPGEPPLLVAVDQEGGAVARLPGTIGPSFAGNMALGAGYAAKGAALARAVGLAQAHQLRYLGINSNFAPAVDVNSNPANPIIDTRSFGDDPERVAELGAALSAGLQAGGVASTLKHFPGHGDTRTDSHTGLPRVDRSRDRALAVDLLPFARIVETQPPDLIMTAHIQYPALDDSTLTGPDGAQSIRPATVSRRILRDLLRDRLGFDGVVVTDALNMASIRELLTPERAVIETFAAGADIALMPFDVTTPADGDRLEALIDQVVAALRRGELDPEPFGESAARVLALRRRLGQTATAIGEEERAAQLAEEQRLDAEVTRAATTVVQGAALLPLDLLRPLRLLAPTPQECAQLRQALEALRADLGAVTCTPMIPRATSGAKPVEPGTIVIGAYRKPRQRPGDGAAPVAAQVATLTSAFTEARAAGATTVLVALGSPYELPRLGAVSDVQVAAFAGPSEPGTGSSRRSALTALVEVLSGRRQPTGRLPVRLERGD
jgi:beta-N-acetylhexosaminidase